MAKFSCTHAVKIQRGETGVEMSMGAILRHHNGVCGETLIMFSEQHSRTDDDVPCLRDRDRRDLW